MKYLVLTEGEQAGIIRDRLRAVEADYMRLSIEPATLAPVAPGEENVNKARLADLEAAAKTLQDKLAKLDDSPVAA